MNDFHFVDMLTKNSLTTEVNIKRELSSLTIDTFFIKSTKTTPKL